MTDIQALKDCLQEITALKQASALLEWDQQTKMPLRGAGSRALQSEAISKLIHELSVSPSTAKLLEHAERQAANLDSDSDDVAFVRVARRDFEKEVRIPTELVVEMAGTTSRAHEVWAKARNDDDYESFAPWLDKIFALTRRVAGHLGFEDCMYDALLDQFEPGMKTAQVSKMYDDLKPRSTALIKKIASVSDRVSDDIVRRNFDIQGQTRFGERIIKELGYELECGRQDQAVHPFCTTIGANDVRITTRYERNWLPAALFGSMHETGHALYELGVADRYHDNILAGGTSLGFHESQSRLWENLVGRSLDFWTRHFDELKSTFPETLSDVDIETFYRAINKVSPSLIRVEADEVTYNMHTMLRFEIENDLLEERISVAEAPDLWNARMKEYLGVSPAKYSDGILQDVHWSGGGIGYFPTYTIGNILSVQLFESAEQQLGASMSDGLRLGNYSPLFQWLRENVYQWGRKYDPSELIERITGGPLDANPYLDYLERKYGAIYNISV